MKLFPWEQISLCHDRGKSKGPGDPPNLAKKTLRDICDSWPFAKAQSPGATSTQLKKELRSWEENGVKCACEMGAGGARIRGLQYMMFKLSDLMTPLTPSNLVRIWN